MICQYSKFDGFSRVENLIVKAKEFKMPAIAMTDHGTFAGAVDFLKTARQHGIKPILGIESYLSRNHKCHSQDGQPDKHKGNKHILLIAKNLIGYQNICTLSQIASIDGYYYNPRIDIELLYKYREGIICSSACLSNIINWNLLRDEYDKAKKAATIFKDIFGEDFYLEMMYHGLDHEAKILPFIVKLSKELDIKLICTNDVHYVEQHDAEYQKVLMCISTRKCIRDPKRLSFPYDEFYLKSQHEMYKVFGHVPEAMANTLEIVDKCDYSDIILGGTMYLPKFDLPNNQSPFEYLKQVAFRGLKAQNLEKSQAHINRLNQELDDLQLIFDTKGYDFATYFLIVHDIMEFAKKNKISAGIRGSGYGSFLLKCLGCFSTSENLVHAIDPIARKDLLFERFLGFDDLYFICDKDLGIRS